MNTTAFPFGNDGNGINVKFATMNAHDTHMTELSSIKQPLSGDSQNSVLAFVRFPQDDVWARSCDGEQWRDVQIRMSYEKLMDLGSSKIRDMFSPRAQARFRRRLGADPVPPGIDYVIDFTPPSEGPELADLTAALWLPRMVKLWFLAGQFLPDPVLEAGANRGLGIPKRPLADKAVGAILTLGHDDVCKNIGCFTDMSHWQARDTLPGIVDENPPFGQKHIPAFRRVEDYCPIRHRVAIVRVLRAINGDGLLLNSAVRMWTVAQVAIYLEVPQVVVDPVAQWLVAPPNTKFIEICPEKAFQLAYALKIPSALIAAFRILVNEQAMDYAAMQPSPHRPPLTWVQRRRDDYGDYPSDPIEYASRAFAERMTGKLAMLQSSDVFDRLPLQIPEWKTLRYLGTLIEELPPCPLLHAYHDLTAALLSVFNDHVDYALRDLNCLSGQIGDLIDAQRKHYIPDFERKSIKYVYEKLTPSQKALTPFFWDRVRMIERTSDFAACHHKGKPLSTHTNVFNSTLKTALDGRVISPDPTHSTLLPYHDSPYSKLFDLPIIFDLPQFHTSLCAAVHTLSSNILHTSSYIHRDITINNDGIPYFLSDHLLLASLEEDTELKYLPIWADGLDDGSGGVFQEVIPPPELGMGPGGPGPGFHTGYTVGSGTDTDTVGGGGRSTLGGMSDLGVGVLSLGDGETLGRSVDVERSVGDDGSGAMGGGKGGVTPSESFTEGSSVYGEARFAQPAAHQAQGVAIEEYVLEGAMGAGSGSVSGESGTVGADDDDDADMDGGGDGDNLGAGSDEEMVFFANSDDSDDDNGDDDDDDGSSTLDGFEEIEADDAADAGPAAAGAAGAHHG